MAAPKPGGPRCFARREALVRHSAIGLGFIDVHRRSGLSDWPVEHALVPGSEAAGAVGAVGAVGDGVADLAPGDRVAYAFPLGAHASARPSPADRLAPIPGAIENATAATPTLKGLTAQHLLHPTFVVEPGVTALMRAAAGGGGRLFGQRLAAKGVTAIGAAGGAEKSALAGVDGYAHVIDHRSETFVDRMREIAGPDGVRAVHGGVGRDTWRGALDAPARHGVFVCFGRASGPVEGFTPADLAAASPHARRPVLFHHIAHIATRAGLRVRARPFRRRRAPRPDRRGAPALCAAIRRQGAGDRRRDRPDPPMRAIAPPDPRRPQCPIQ